VVTDFEDGLLRATSAVFGRQVDQVLPNGTLMVNICLNNGGAVSTIPSMYKVSAVARCLKLSSVAKAITLVLASEPLSLNRNGCGSSSKVAANSGGICQHTMHLARFLLNVFQLHQMQ
jgi:hypothetical protein